MIAGILAAAFLLILPFAGIVLIVVSLNKVKKLENEVSFLRGRLADQQAHRKNGDTNILRDEPPAASDAVNGTPAASAVMQSQQANLQQANLQQANLQQASLQQANLQQASLQQANPQQASPQQVQMQKQALPSASSVNGAHVNKGPAPMQNRPAPYPAGRGPVPAAVKPQQSEAPDLENFFLGNIFGKLGALAIIVFVILLIKWASPFLVLTPEIKVGGVYLLSAVFCGIGFSSLKKPNMRAVSELMIGLGFASAIMITYAGSLYFSLWPETVSIVLASAILAGIYLCACFMQRISVLCMGIIAGYANLIFIVSNFDSPESFCVYLIFISLFCAAGAVRCRAWHALVSCNLIVSSLFLCIYSDSSSVMALCTWGAIWAVHILYDFFRTEKADISSLKQNFSIYFNHSAMLITAYCFFHENKTGVCILLFSMCAALAALAYLKRSSAPRIAAACAYMAIFCAAGAVNRFDSDMFAFLALGAMGLLVISAGLRFKESNTGRNFLTWGYVYLGLMFLKINFIDKYYFTSADHNGHAAVLIYSICAAFWLAAYFMLKAKNSGKEHFNEVALWAAVTIMFEYAGIELDKDLNHILADSDRVFRTNVTYFSNLIVLLIYSIQSVFQYRRGGCKFFAFSGGFAAFAASGAFLFNALSHAPMFPIANLGFVSYGLAVILTALCAYLYKKDVYLVWSAFLFWGLVHTEGINFVEIFDIEAITTVFWSLCASMILFAGIKFKKRTLTYSGIFIVCCTLLRVITYDIAKLSIGYKILSFFILGVVLLAVSFFYSKYKKTTAPDASGTAPLSQGALPSGIPAAQAVNAYGAVNAQSAAQAANAYGAVNAQPAAQSANAYGAVNAQPAAQSANAYGAVNAQPAAQPYAEQIKAPSWHQ